MGSSYRWLWTERQPRSSRSSPSCKLAMRTGGWRRPDLRDDPQAWTASILFQRFRRVAVGREDTPSVLCSTISRPTDAIAVGIDR